MKTARREQARKRQAGRRLMAGGVVWIVGIAALLGGVVAVNVAVLRLNLSVDGVNRERAKLKAEIAADSSKLASTRATARIVSASQSQAGLVYADPAATTYVTLKPHR
jgi:hypothetical protein